MSRVLVTGGTGFLGSHIVVQLLQAGHEVCATVRNMERRADLHAMIRAGGADPSNLMLIEADLERNVGWQEAATQCDVIMHVASPFPSGHSGNEEAVVRPARDGTLRVMQAARAAGVKRVVMTSSFAAVGYGQPGRRDPFDESCWSPADAPDVLPYIKSKILAERGAWDFSAQHADGPELTVINPTGIFGPVLGHDYASSIELVSAMLDGRMPFAPRVHFGVVDVRDVAALHIAAMAAPQAAGERFIAASGEPVSMIWLAKFLRQNFGAAAAKAPRLQLPDFLVKFLALFVPALREVVPQLGIYRQASGEKARRLLGWKPRSTEETILATAKSLLMLYGKAGP